VNLLDIKKELKNYPVIDIDLVTKRDPSIPDSIKNSMVLYNKALDSLHMNNDDMAIIKLKKAIAMNPSFYEAMNLLGVIHSGSGDNEKAKKVFQEVIDAEGNSIKAQNYIALINGSVPDESSGKLKKGYNVKTVDNKELKLTFKQMIFYSFKKDALKYIIGIVLGVVAGLLIFGLQEKPDFTEERNKYESQLEEKNNEYNTLKEKNNLLESERKTEQRKKSYKKNGKMRYLKALNSYLKLRQ
jgi:tetratricopeptide (TPR) repeat protein